MDIMLDLKIMWILSKETECEFNHMLFNNYICKWMLVGTWNSFSFLDHKI